MTDRFSDQSPRSTARIAGFLYFMYIAASVVADLLGHFAFGDSAAIISTIAAHPALFRAGLVIGLLSSAFFLLAAWALYVLLKPVNKNLSLLFLLLNAVGVAIQSLSMLGLIARPVAAERDRLRERVSGGSIAGASDAVHRPVQEREFDRPGFLRRLGPPPWLPGLQVGFPS